MNWKFLLVILFSSAIVFSCSDKKESEKENTESKKEESLNIDQKESNFYSGKVVILYKNGNIKYVENYREGSKQGEYMNCYKTGQKKAEGLYSSGKRVGTWVWYDENGEICFSINYDNIA